MGGDPAVAVVYGWRDGVHVSGKGRRCCAPSLCARLPDPFCPAPTTKAGRAYPKQVEYTLNLVPMTGILPGDTVGLAACLASVLVAVMLALRWWLNRGVPRILKAMLPDVKTS